MGKTACTQCGAQILNETAEKFAGSCAPCAREMHSPPAYSSDVAFNLAAALMGLNVLIALTQVLLGVRAEDGVRNQGYSGRRSGDCAV